MVAAEEEVVEVVVVSSNYKFVKRTQLQFEDGGGDGGDDEGGGRGARLGGVCGVTGVGVVPRPPCT